MLKKINKALNSIYFFTTLWGNRGHENKIVQSSCKKISDFMSKDWIIEDWRKKWDDICIDF
jgi:hypothetical protein